MSTPAASPKVTEIRLAHSPDSDDAFMFYALATGKVRLPGVKFEHILSDIESLNQAAKKRSVRRDGDQFLRLSVCG
jgi:1,4-dihydroxy-6-naphthoate synthase